MMIVVTGIVLGEDFAVESVERVDVGGPSEHGLYAFRWPDPSVIVDKDGRAVFNDRDVFFVVFDLKGDRVGRDGEESAECEREGVFEHKVFLSVLG